MDKIFGLAEQALGVTEQRATMLSGNIVNSNTPGYKAKDIDFDQVMKEVTGSAESLQVTNKNHISTTNVETGNLPFKYRIPMQTSLDGNTVDTEIELKNFMQNAMKYQVSLSFIQNKTDQIIKAMKGD